MGHQMSPLPTRFKTGGLSLSQVWVLLAASTPECNNLCWIHQRVPWVSPHLHFSTRILSFFDTNVFTSWTSTSPTMEGTQCRVG